LNGDRPLHPRDPGYPEPLRHIPDPPSIYWRGRPWTGAPAVAIVGTRQATPYGLAVAADLAGRLAQLGIVIVSGLARGIDASAHRGCLESGGTTLAVLGCGLDVHYPPEHAGLAEAIAGSGALLSEWPPRTPPRAFHFPARNRIISGLAAGVVVVEAAERSGALITARLAGEQGREVFAVPGSIRSPQSVGSHRLIQDGAKLVADIDDVLSELRLPARGREPQGGSPTTLATIENALDLQVLKAIHDNPMHIDALARGCAIPHAILLERLTFLEMTGYIMRTQDQRITALHNPHG